MIEDSKPAFVRNLHWHKLQICSYWGEKGNHPIQYQPLIKRQFPYYVKDSQDTKPQCKDLGTEHLPKMEDKLGEQRIHLWPYFKPKTEYKQQQSITKKVENKQQPESLN